MNAVTFIGMAVLGIILLLQGATALAASDSASPDWVPWAIYSGSCKSWPQLAWDEAARLPAVQAMAENSDHFDPPAVRIVESGQISARALHDLTEWVEAGGVALISGAPAPDMSWCNDETRAEPDDILALAGLRAGWHDPSLVRSRPAIVQDTKLLFPLRSGDGLSLGAGGLGHAWGLEVVNAKPLALVYLDNPAAGFSPVIEQHPAITERTFGQGKVYFTSFSLARVAHCYPDDDGAATDCRAAASMQSLMRIMLANMLWFDAGVQWPLPRHSPGRAASVVVVTGDVHADPQGMQIKAALRMAEVADEVGVPVTFFVVGEVAQSFPAQFQQLRSMDNVEIGTHSLRGQQYRQGHSIIPFRRRGGVHGSAAVHEDVRAAEQLLGLAQWPAQRAWLAAVRTEAWGSNESESGAWTGMGRAGIALVLDHNVDAVTSHPAITPPRDWLTVNARKRLSLPAFSRNVHTASDDFRTPEAGLDQMFTLPSPQPDPCCNRAIRFSDYLDYVRSWHDALTGIGTMTGATQVWLWHPSTPAIQGAFEELKRTLQGMADDDRVRFSTVHELATWNVNRHRGRLELRLGDDSAIEAMHWKPSANEGLAPLPPGSHIDAGTVSYWIHGTLEMPGWESYPAVIDEHDITILSRAAGVP